MLKKKDCVKSYVKLWDHMLPSFLHVLCMMHVDTFWKHERFMRFFRKGPLTRKMHIPLSLQMIDIGCSGRLTSCQDTHSPYTSMDTESLHIRLTPQSGGSPTDLHTSSLVTGTIYPNKHRDTCSKIWTRWKYCPYIKEGVFTSLYMLLSLYRYWRYSEETRTTDRDFPKPNTRWGRIPDSPKGAFLSDDGGEWWPLRKQIKPLIGAREQLLLNWNQNSPIKLYI